MSNVWCCCSGVRWDYKNLLSPVSVPDLDGGGGGGGAEGIGEMGEEWGEGVSGLFCLLQNEET